MENIIGVMVEKYRKGSGKRSVEHIKKIVEQKELEEFEVERFTSIEEHNDFVLLNILSYTYQKGISAGKKLASKNDMNEIDAVQFAIKELQKVKDELKSSIADEIVKKS